MRSKLSLMPTCVVLIVVTFLIFNFQLRKHENMADSERSKPRLGGESVWWRGILCKSRETYEDHEKSILLQQLFRDITPNGAEDNVFLVESTCKHRPLIREWCAVESWARQNPEMKVWFVMTSDTADDTDSLPSRLLGRYENLHIVGADLDGIFAGTPAEEFFKSGVWAQNEDTADGHLSDMMRTAMIWRWGGYYSDTDMMCLSDMRRFRSAIGFEMEDSLNCAFFNMRRHEQYLLKIMAEMTESHNPAVWRCIGPDLYTKIMKRECEANNIKLEYQEEPMSCINITIYPVNAFYPILYVDYLLYFKDGMDTNILKDFKRSSIFHFWNKASKKSPVRIGGRSIYDQGAKEFCPMSYEQAVRRSKFF